MEHIAAIVETLFLGPSPGSSWYYMHILVFVFYCDFPWKSVVVSENICMEHIYLSSSYWKCWTYLSKSSIDEIMNWLPYFPYFYDATCEWRVQGQNWLFKHDHVK